MARVDGVASLPLAFNEVVDVPRIVMVRPLLGLGSYDETLSAWDVYLMYSPGRVWSGPDPGRPDDWAHNLVDPLPGVKRLSLGLVRTWSASPGAG